MDHAIWTEQSVLPSVRCDQTRITEQSHGTGEQIVEVLNGNVYRACVIYLYRNGLLVRIGVAAESGQEVAYATFCRKVVVEEAEA